MVITDLIVRIKNGYMAKNTFVQAPHSKMKEAILVKLKYFKYIKDYTVTGEIKKSINVELLYNNGVPAITNIKLFSKPGRKWYVSHSEIGSVLGGMGKAVISTSKGIMSGAEAKKAKLGGELLFHIW